MPNDPAELSRPATRYHFAEFILDVSARTLTRDGADVHIERRALDLLQYVIENRGHLVTKQQLIEAVWKNRPVTDNALSRCVSLVREALNDPAHDSKYVITVHGQGIRFAGDVTVTAETDGTPRKYRVIAGVLAVLVLLIGAIAWLPPKEPPTEAIVVTLLPAFIPDDSPGTLLLSASMNELLFQRLSETRGLRLRRSTIFADSDDPFSDAEELGVDYIVATQLNASRPQPKVQLQVELHGVRDGSRVQVGRFDLPTLDDDDGIRQFMDIREDVVKRIATQLLPAIAQNPHSATRTRSADAYHLYLEARDLLGRPGCDGKEPNRLLEQSLAIEPEYVPAWVHLGWAQYGLAATCGLGRENYELALASADKALQLAPGWTPAIGLRATVLVETGQLERAFETLSAAWSEMPGNADLAFFFSYVLSYAGELERSRAWLDHCLRLDGQFLIAEGWTPNVLLYQQEPEEFLVHLPATRSTLFNFYRGLALTQTGQVDEALAVLEDAYQLNPTDIFGRMSRALMAIVNGSNDEAITILNDLVRQRTDQYSSDGEVSFKIAQLLAMAGADESALRELGISRDQGFLCPVCIVNDPRFEQVRALDGYVDFIAELSASQRALEFPEIEVSL